MVEEWWVHRNRPPPDMPAADAERWWSWHDQARAMTHALYADQGWEVLVEGPVSPDVPVSGAAMIEAGVAAECPGDEAATEGAIAGITRALTDIRTTLAAAYRSLPRPAPSPVISGPLPIPPEEQ